MSVIGMTQTRNEEDFERFQTMRIAASEWRVLLALAYDGPQSMYAISKKNKTLYPTVHRATSNLKKNKWVEVTATRPSEKNVTTNTYSLTREGLLWIFTRKARTIPAKLVDSSNDDETVKRRMKRMENAKNMKLENMKTETDFHLHLLFSLDVDKIAEANAKLFPSVFEKWDSYRKSDIAFVLSQAFPEAALSTLRYYYYGDDGPRSKFKTLEKLFAYESYRAAIETFSRGYVTRPSKTRKEYLNEILSMYEQNPEIQDILDQVLSEMETTSKKTLDLLKKIQAAQPSKPTSKPH
jgi:DNA-binding MarR family transcriptional regulator